MKEQLPITERFQIARKRALLLDYDGTLVPFSDTPELARPDAELITLLGRLASDESNEVVIISGRKRSDLENWLGHLPIGLIAEHGVWLRVKNAWWRPLKSSNPEWKDRVRPLLQLYVDRLPGALLEEKESSLAWHFRRAEPEEAIIRAKELIEELADLDRKLDLQALQGNKVLEIRQTGATKGTAALDWLALTNPDFMLAIGDDATDEDLFRVMPPEAFTIRVGLAPTAARFRLGNHNAVRELLWELAEAPATAAFTASQRLAAGSEALSVPLIDGTSVRPATTGL